MSLIHCAGLILSIGMGAYLAYALLFPERFQ